MTKKTDEVLPPGVLSRTQKNILLGLQIAVAVVFVLYGAASLRGNKNIVDIYNVARLGDGVRIGSAIVGFIGAALIVIPRTAFIGGIVLALVALEYVLLALRVHQTPMLYFILLWAAATIAWFRKPDTKANQ